MTHNCSATLPGVADLTRCPHCGRSLRFLSVGEAAAELGKGRQTIRYWIRNGTIQGAVREDTGGTRARFLVPAREVARLRRSLPDD